MFVCLAGTRECSFERAIEYFGVPWCSHTLIFFGCLFCALEKGKGLKRGVFGHLHLVELPCEQA